MQAASQPFKLHWIPVRPSWIISVGLVVLAVLPKQVPYRHVFRSPLGIIAFGALSVYVMTLHPVLGMAMLIFLAGMNLASVESFANAPILNKDVANRKKTWFVENTLNENPKGIQERTDNPSMQFDEITSDEHWYDEDVMGVDPHGIQEKPVDVHHYEYDDSPSTAGIGRG
jgi:hypothetical protein